MTKSLQGMMLLGAIVLCCYMLSFYQTTSAAPHAPPPFANSVEQRFETINELREIRELMKEHNALVKEQIALLRSGEVKVVMATADKQAERAAEQ